MNEVSIQALLVVLLAPERSTVERLQSLRELKDFLQDEEVLHALGRAARTEKSLEVRQAMLSALLAVDITRVAQRGETIDHLAFFAAMEPESTLRLMAVTRLVQLAPAEPSLEILLSETLIYDLDPAIQAACLKGIRQCAHKQPQTIQRLLEYARRAPLALHAQTVDLLQTLERPACETGLLLFLTPAEPEALRRRIIENLAQFPTLSRDVTAGLLERLWQEPSADLQNRIVILLARGIQVIPELLEQILLRLQTMPGQSELLFAFRDRLFSLPEMVPALVGLFRHTNSRSLKLGLLQLLEASGQTELFLQALNDASPWVRNAALRGLAARLQQETAPIVRALLERLAAEPLAAIRQDIAVLLEQVQTFGPDAENLLISAFVRETDPTTQENLANSLLRVDLTPANRTGLLPAYVRLLQAPFFSRKIKADITRRLRSFAFADEPGLKEVLKSLLMRATDLHDVEELYGQLSKLETDVQNLLPLLRTLFYRFVGEYAQEPLARWLRIFHDLAPSHEDLRREIPSLAQMTNESWILDAAEAQDRKAGLLAGILESLTQGNPNEAERLLNTAYADRNLRKSDIISLFNRLLHYHNHYPLLDRVLDIMREANVCSPEIIGRCFDFLTRFPNAAPAYDLQRYLVQTASLDPAYSGHLFQDFNQTRYTEYCLRHLNPHCDLLPPHFWEDSGHWRVLHPGWPIAELLLKGNARPALVRILDIPPDPAVTPLQSLQYFALRMLYNLSQITAGELSVIGRLMRAAQALPHQAPLYDRALFVLCQAWPKYILELEKSGQAVPEELARMAAEAFWELCQRRQKLLSTALIAPVVPLSGLDLLHLEQQGNQASAVWEKLWRDYAEYLDPESDIHAAPEPLFLSIPFLPLKSDHPLLEFLVKTPVPETDTWKERWKSLLAIAVKHHRPQLSREVARLPEVRRAALLPLLP